MRPAGNHECMDRKTLTSRVMYVGNPSGKQLKELFLATESRFSYRSFERAGGKLVEVHVLHQYRQKHWNTLKRAPLPALFVLTSTMMLSRGPRVVGRAGTYRTPFASSLPVPRSWVSTSSNSIARFDRLTTFTWWVRAREDGPA